MNLDVYDEAQKKYFPEQYENLVLDRSDTLILKNQDGPSRLLTKTIKHNPVSDDGTIDPRFWKDDEGYKNLFVKRFSIYAVWYALMDEQELEANRGSTLYDERKNLSATVDDIVLLSYKPMNYHINNKFDFITIYEHAKEAYDLKMGVKYDEINKFKILDVMIDRYREFVNENKEKYEHLFEMREEILEAERALEYQPTMYLYFEDEIMPKDNKKKIIHRTGKYGKFI